MSIFDKMMNGFKSHSEAKKEVDDEKLKEKLKGILYDDELVDEMLPVFSKLSAQEGFETIVDLLESKEKQIGVLSGQSKWTKESTPSKEEEMEVDDSTDPSDDDGVDSLIEAKYSKQN